MLWRRSLSLLVLFSLLVVGTSVLAQSPGEDPPPPPDAPRTVSPVYVLPSGIVAITGADVMLVIDKSGSMASESKLDDAKNAAKAFVDQMSFPPDQVGVVAFDNSATTYSWLSGNANEVKASIDSIQSIGGGTDIAAGIRDAQTELAGPRHIASNLPVQIVLSDGMSSYDEAVRAANAAKQAGTAIFSIGLGSDVDPGLMKAIASSPDYYYYAPTGADLARIYHQISVRIPLSSSVREAIEQAGFKVAAEYAGNVATGDTAKHTFTKGYSSDLMVVVAWGGSTFEVCVDGTFCEEDDVSPIEITVPDAGPGPHEIEVGCTADCDDGEDYVVGAGEEEQRDVPPPVPEASTLILMASGLTGLAGYATVRWRAKRAT